jgi:serine/threonine-protein kinase HipA
MILNVQLNGRSVGRLADTEVNGRTCVFFEYDPEWIRTGLDLSPLRLPLGPGLRSREGSAPCEQLPGLFEDSLPDTWGMRPLLDWFQKRGITAHRVTPLMQLGYIGDRGMGALSYLPEDGPETMGELDLNQIYADMLAAESGGAFTDTLTEVGSSAGGAQPKALVGIRGDAKLQFWTGTRSLPEGFEPWLVKFSGKRTDTPGSDGRVEYAYSLMARAAGIDLPPTRLVSAGRRLHFAAKRFDREGSERIHCHTFARMVQTPGADLDYETLLRITAAVTKDHREVVRGFRRAVFNVLARNDDDHGRNHAFQLRDREWTLTPAYDVTFRRLHERGLAVCGERRSVGSAQLQTLATRTDIDRATVAEIFDQVRNAISRWRKWADEAEVPATIRADIERALRV